MISASLLLSLVTLLTPGSVATADEIVAFPDLHLETAIRGEIGKPTGGIYKSDLEGLIRLSADSEGIVDLTGLEYCTSLAYLSLWGNEISDVAALSSLSSLTQLDLGNNRIGDISPISGLTGLTWLRLDRNRIDDISPLLNLTSLKELSLGQNQISDISPISSLASLTHLNLGQNQLSDISPISSLTGLIKLDLRRNQIADISPLSHLTSLINVYLEQNQIGDVSPLVENSGLNVGDTLDLRDNPLSTTSLNVHIPELEQRGVNVWWTPPRTAPSTSVPDGEAPFNLWSIIGLVAGLLVAGSIAYYLVLLRRALKKRASQKR